MLWATHWQKLAQGKNPLRQHREAARWQLSVYLPPLDLKWQKKTTSKSIRFANVGYASTIEDNHQVHNTHKQARLT